MEGVARRAALAGGLFALLAAAQRAPAPLVWIEDSFDDFRDGRFDASGADLYATRKGTIETVNRFDLNGDGHPDLVFNSSHDEVRIVPPTCVEMRAGSRQGAPCDLPAPGTSRGVIADLNNDGHPEAVLAPNNDGVATRRYLSIFWGAANGWSGRRHTGLITIEPRAVDAGDLDGDGWKEIAVLNGSRWAVEDGPEAVLRVYRGSADSYSQERHSDTVIARAVDMKVRDLDGDGRAEVIVLCRDPGEVLVYRPRGTGLGEPARLPLGTPGAGRLALADYDGDGKLDFIVNGGVREELGRDPTTGETIARYSGVVIASEGRAPRVLKAPPSSDLAAADLDGDRRPEIILADPKAPRDSVHILWSGGRAPSTLPAAYASAVAVEDLDGDGRADVAVGVARGEATYQAKSYVFFGGSQNGFVAGPAAFDTAEVAGVVAARVGERGRVIFLNSRAGRVNEDVPVEVFWGDGKGFSGQRVSRYSIRSGYASSAADLNQDGYPDLVLLSIVHAVDETHPGLGFNILWGGKEGFDDNRRTVVPEYALWGLNVADVDRDGWLDLIGNCNRPNPEGEPARVVVWHGGPKGFLRERRVALRAGGAEGQSVVADFNKDGYPDIAVARERAHLVTIFWGSREGYSDRRQSSLPLVAANDMKTADLDKDGWLDLVVTSHKLPRSAFFDYGTVIYWGGPEGFRATNAQRLPAHDGIGVAIADFDADGFLDIYTPGYHYGYTRESVASHLFWGSARGFTSENRTDLMQDGGHGAMAADFNNDGRLDLAVACHTRNGTHHTESLVFFGDGARFRTAVPARLPTVGPHFMQRADVGNVYDRSWRQTYESSAFTWEGARSRAELKWKADTPGGARLEFFVRAAESKAGLAAREWVPYRHGGVPLREGDRALEYRAAFVSDNGDRYPALDRVEISVR